MGKNERQACLKVIRSRLSPSAERAKAAMPDEFCSVCGYHRKAAKPIKPAYGIDLPIGVPMKSRA